MAAARLVIANWRQRVQQSGVQLVRAQSASFAHSPAGAALALGGALAETTGAAGADAAGVALGGGAGAASSACAVGAAGRQASNKTIGA